MTEYPTDVMKEIASNDHKPVPPLPPGTPPPIVLHARAGAHHCSSGHFLLPRATMISPLLQLRTGFGTVSGTAPPIHVRCTLGRVHDGPGHRDRT